MGLLIIVLMVTVFLQSDSGEFPEIRWSLSDYQHRRDTLVTSTQAFKLFVLGFASYQVIFENADNRKLRDMFLTYVGLPM